MEFFKRVRAAYYVVSGNDTANGEPNRAVLDSLLEGKAQWGENLQVSKIVVIIHHILILLFIKS